MKIYPTNIIVFNLFCVHFQRVYGELLWYSYLFLFTQMTIVLTIEIGMHTHVQVHMYLYICVYIHVWNLLFWMDIWLEVILDDDIPGFMIEMAFYGITTLFILSLSWIHYWCELYFAAVYKSCNCLFYLSYNSVNITLTLPVSALALPLILIAILFYNWFSEYTSLHISKNTTDLKNYLRFHVQFIPLPSSYWCFCFSFLKA